MYESKPPESITTMLVHTLLWGALTLGAIAILIYFFTISDDYINDPNQLPSPTSTPKPTIEPIHTVPIWERQWEASTNSQRADYCNLYKENSNMLYSAFKYGSNEYGSNDYNDWYNDTTKQGYNEYFQVRCIK
jgi:hypothetical protein